MTNDDREAALIRVTAEAHEAALRPLDAPGVRDELRRLASKVTELTTEERA